MRRSLLFIPGNTPKMVENADVFASDSVIIDLEDAVLLSEKDSARILVKQYLDDYKLNNIEIIIRVNSFDTPYFFEDVKLLTSNDIDTFMIPKANNNDLIEIDNILTNIEKEKNLHKRIKLIPIIETCEAVLHLEEIALCNRVDGLLLGAEDLASDLEVKRTIEGKEIFYARSKLAITAKSLKIDAIDTPFTDIYDEIGLEQDAKLSKSLGLNAKSCIHPNQVEVVNKIFSPSNEEILHAKRVIAASLKAENKSKGAFSLDGKMVDEPIIKRAKKILEKAEKFDLLN